MGALLGAIPTLLNVVPTFVGLAENLFSGKPKSGASKKATVVKLATTAVQAAGHVDPTAVPMDALEKLIGGISDVVTEFYNVVGAFKHGPAAPAGK